MRGKVPVPLPSGEDLHEIIRYLKAEEITGDFSRELDDAVKSVKSNEERRAEYMFLSMRENEILAEGIEQGIEQGIERGNILRTISLYRKLVHASDEQISEVLRQEFNLTDEEIDDYFTQASIL